MGKAPLPLALRRGKMGGTAPLTLFATSREVVLQSNRLRAPSYQIISPPSEINSGD